jgi:hypothetical protein
VVAMAETQETDSLVVRVAMVAMVETVEELGL